MVGVSLIDPQLIRQPCTMQLVVQADGVVAFPQQEDPLDRLAKLADLKNAGALTDGEFQAQKAKILESM